MNKRQRSVLGVAAAALLLPLSILADGTVTGKVVNNETGQPMDFVMVQLVDAKTNKPLTIGAQTDENGSFTLKAVPNGNYIVRITNIGSVSQERDITVSNNTIDLQDIALADDVKMLQEVVVEGVRSQMKFDLDKRVFSVDSSVLAAGQSASELLEAIPSVEVDQEGEISLRGNSSVTVWINGKESGLTADNRAQILEQIPAESIERVEVITNPSAKYSPEGTAGIINIVLKQNRKAGYFGSAEIGANTKGGGNVGVNINYSDSKWELFGGIGFRMRHNSGGSWSERTYDALNDNGEHYFLNSDGDSKSHGNNLFLRLGATYHLTQKDEFSLSGFGMFGHRWGKSSTFYTSNMANHWLSNLNSSHTNSDNHGMNLEFSYLHKWNDNHTLSASVGYNKWGGPNNSTYLQETEYADAALSEEIYQDQKQEINTGSVETKVDYSVKLNDYVKIEAGYNGNYSHENTPVTTWNAPQRIDANIEQDLYNRFIYDNDITAFYLTLGGNAGKFSYSAGVRAETWQIRTKSLSYGETEEEVPQFKKNKFSLFPSLFLSYSLPHDNELQINYTRRIRRPWGGQLNTFKDISNPTDISYGNSELQPEYTNAFELNYIKSWDSHMISVSGYLRTADDIMNRLSYITQDGVMYTTWGNVSQSVNSGAEFIVKNQFFRRVFELTTTANVYQSHLSAWDKDFVQDGVTYSLSGNKQNSFAWDIRCMASVRLPWNISFQATGRYNSRMNTAQGSREPSWTVDAGLRKSLGNWSFSVNARDLFDSRKMNNVTNGVGYSQHSKRWRGGRNINFTIKYSFGNMKSKRNKLQENVPEDGSGYSSEGMQ
jgi:outer membrane receptor protein involved in Fe transport